MITQETHRIGRQLDEVGHALTSFEALGLPFPGQEAGALQDAIRATEQHALVQAEGRTGMLMHRENAPLEAGRLIAGPIVELLFPGQPGIKDALGMYAINEYETGDFFNPHQDHFDGTVMISTILGARNFDVYKKEPEDDVFHTITASHYLDVGSIVLLNGYKNLGHAAQCDKGPSISVVSDVPYPIAIR